MVDLEELAVGFAVGFVVGFVAGFAAGFVAGFAADFAVDFVVDFVVDFEVEDLPPFLVPEARISARVRGNTKIPRISIRNGFSYKRRASPTFKPE